MRWNVMLTQSKLPIRKGEKYAVAFRIRASTPRQVSVETAHAGPYKGYFARTFETTPDWKDRQYSFVASDDDENVRLSFQLGDSTRILLTAVGRCANTGMTWNAERNSLADQWGGPPILIEPVEGRVTLHHSARALEVVALDGRGMAIGKPLTISRKDGEFPSEPKADPAAVWHVVTERR